MKNTTTFNYRIFLFLFFFFNYFFLNAEEIVIDNNIETKINSTKNSIRNISNIFILKKVDLIINGVLTNNNQFYKKIKIIKKETGLVVWELKKKKLNNWGPIYSFKDRISLKKGTFQMDIICVDNSFALFFKNKKSNKYIGKSSFKAGKDSLTDNMIDLFIEDELNRYSSNKLIEKSKKEFSQNEMAIQKAQEEYRRQYFKKGEREKLRQFQAEKHEKNKKKEIEAKEKFEELLQKERAIRRKSEEVAREKYEVELKRKEITLQKVEKMQIAVEKKEQFLKIIEERINRELINDKLIKKGEKFSLVLSSKAGLFLNGKKLGNNYYKKYKKIYEKYSGEKLLNNRRLVLNGKYISEKSFK